MIVLYSIIAIFIAWIWIDYYRFIDIFEKEKLIFVISSFILGGLSVFIVFGFQEIVYSNFNLGINGNFLNDLFYTSIIIGATEELAKLVPFLILLILIKEEITEPIDYIVYITASALGFSAVENIMYFNNYGSTIVFSRAILSSVTHMFCSAIVAYGIMRFKFHPKHKNKYYQVIIFFFLASLSHGIYNFLLMYDPLGPIGGILNFLYYLITISVFAVIINNCLNNSPLFTYKKVIDNRLIANKLIFYYGIVLLAQFIFIYITDDFNMAILSIFYTLITAGFIAFISIVRLTRFKLIKGRWENIKLEFPFSIQTTDGANVVGRSVSDYPRLRLRIKGHAYNEIHLNKYYQEYFRLKPLNCKRSYLKKPRRAYIIEKFFLGDYTIFYLVNIYYGDNNEKTKQILISPKTSGKMLSTKDEAIVSVFIYEDLLIDLKNINPKKIKFQEWALAINSKEMQAIDELKLLAPKN